MFPAANSQQRLSASSGSSEKVSKKVPLPPGRSLVDWIRLTKSGRDLKRTGPRLLQISEDELAKHNKVDDLWLALRGMVYNVTLYIEYHPGGAEELMKGAGRDATSLFEEVHRWVNYESMLKACLVGKLVTIAEKPAFGSAMLAPPKPNIFTLDPIGVNKLKLNKIEKLHSSTPVITIEDFTDQDASYSDTKDTKPNYDWYQTEQFVNLILYCKSSSMTKEQFMCDVEDTKVYVNVKLGTTLHSYIFKLSRSVARTIDFKLSKSGKAQLILQKAVPGESWQTLGSVSESDTPFFAQNMSDVRYCQYSIVQKVPLTHDTCLYELASPASRFMSVPIGYHVFVKVHVEGIEVSRPYTPVVPSLVDPRTISNTNLYLAVKHYENGAVTSMLEPTVQGDRVWLSTFDGNFDFSKLAITKTCVMLAAGTGITPMIKVMHALLHGGNNCSVHLIFFNKSQKDIIWRSEFEELKAMFQSRLYLMFVLSNPDKSWTGVSGRISRELINDYSEKYIPKGEYESTLFLICGPNEFSNLGSTIVQDIGFLNSHVFM